MYCMKCGKEIDDTAKYCNECGHKVGEKLNKTESTLAGIQIGKTIENGKTLGNGILNEIKENTSLSLNECISLVIMVLAIILCFMPWLTLPDMGSYSPLEWKSFMENVGYNIGVRAYERANIIPGMYIWINMPLVFYIINMIAIIKNKSCVVLYEIVGILFSIGIFFYAKLYFAFYDSYELGGYTHCTIGAAFYIMFVLVVIDILRNKKVVKNK